MDEKARALEQKLELAKIEKEKRKRLAAEKEKKIKAERERREAEEREREKRRREAELVSVAMLLREGACSISHPAPSHTPPHRRRRPIASAVNARRERGKQR